MVPTRMTTPASTRSTRSKTAKAPSLPPTSDAYVHKWKNELQATDPIFRDMDALLEAENTTLRAIQPFDHSQPLYYPSIAFKFGLQRYIPNAQTPFGKGPKCIGGCKDHSKSFPAFMYRHPDLVCSQAQSDKNDTVVFRYTVTTAEDGAAGSKLHCMSCWSCSTKAKQKCPLMGAVLDELTEVSSPYVPGRQIEEQNDHEGGPLSPVPSNGRGAVGLTPVPPSPSVRPTDPHTPVPSQSGEIFDHTTMPPSSPVRPVNPPTQETARLLYEMRPLQLPKRVERSGEDLEEGRQFKRRDTRPRSPSPAAMVQHISWPSNQLQNIIGRINESEKPAVQARVVSDSASTSSRAPAASDLRAGRRWLHNRQHAAPVVPALDPETLQRVPNLPNIPEVTSSRPPSPRTGTEAFRPSSDIVRAAELVPEIAGAPKLVPEIAGASTAQSDRFKKDILDCFHEISANTKAHLSTIEQHSVAANEAVQGLFRHCGIVERQALADREALAAAMVQQGQLKNDLAQMDTRLASYHQDLLMKDQELVEAQKQVRFLQEALETSRDQQHVIDQRMASAVLERDRAMAKIAEAEAAEVRMAKERDSAKANCVLLESRLKSKDAELLEATEAVTDAIKESDEAQEALLKTQAELSNAKAEIAKLQDHLASALGDHSTPKATGAEPVVATESADQDPVAVPSSFIELFGGENVLPVGYRAQSVSAESPNDGARRETRARSIPGEYVLDASPPASS